MTEQPTLPMAMPEHHDPNPRPVELEAHCRFCRAIIPADDQGLIAWGLCEPCFDGVEFAA